MLLFLALASGSKAPFLFQNLAFSWIYLRERRYALCALAAAMIPLFLYFGYVTYYATAVTTGEHGLFLLDPEGGSYLAIAVFFRSIEILEGLFYTFVPIGAYAVSALHLLSFCAILLACWGAILYDIAGMHLPGVLLNYSANRSDCFELDPRFEMQCQGTEVPAEEWNRWPLQIVDRFVKDVLQ